LFVAGLGIFIYVVVIWSESGFGFEGGVRIREMVVATTLMVAGLQTVFGGFIIALLGEKRVFGNRYSVTDPPRVPSAHILNPGDAPPAQ
jgi:hypothetical protein